MSEPTTEPTAAAEPQAQGEPANEPLGEPGKKALSAEREARKAAEQATAALQKQLDEINAANMSDLERAQKQAADAQTEAERARAEALRFRVAAKHGITDEDADLFLTGSDAETLERQATRLVERTPTSPKPDPSQGARGDAPKGSTADLFAAAIEPHFTR